jgi:C-terminal processing protease CtpA/Prc
MVLYPGAFLKSPGSAYYKIDNPKLPLYKGRLIILVDEHTQSLAESVVYELRLRPNTIVMGRQTAGTTGNILWVSYPGGISVSFTGLSVTGMDGSFNEGKGVKIDKKIDLCANDLVKYPDFMRHVAYLEALKNNK